MDDMVQITSASFPCYVYTEIIGDDFMGEFDLHVHATCILCRINYPSDQKNCLRAYLQTRQQMLFLHEGDLLLFSADAPAMLNTSFLEGWTRSVRPQTWPPRSPDLNHKHFFLWGHVKKDWQIKEQLQDRIQNSSANIRQSLFSTTTYPSGRW